MLPDPRFIEARSEDLCRPGPDPRPRGPFRRHPLSLAAPALPDLVHAASPPRCCAASSTRAGIKGVPINVVAPGERFRVGPFDCALIQVTHSIPEAHALAIRTPLGNVLHTGDWKLDPAPLVGAADRRPTRSRRSATRACWRWSANSTNILNPGTSGSEAEVRDSLMELIGRQSTRVADDQLRLQRRAARDRDQGRGARAGARSRAVGRSMRRMIEAAREVGYLQDMPDLLDERTRPSCRATSVLWLAPAARASRARRSTRIAAGQHPTVALEPGDVVIFSSQDHPRQRAHPLQPAQQPDPRAASR